MLRVLLYVEECSRKSKRIATMGWTRLEFLNNEVSLHIRQHSGMHKSFCDYKYTTVNYSYNICYVPPNFLSFLLIAFSRRSITCYSECSISWLVARTVTSLSRLAILLASLRELPTMISNVSAAPLQERLDWRPGLRNFEVPGTSMAKPVKYFQWGLPQEA